MTSEIKTAKQVQEAINAAFAAGDRHQLHALFSPDAVLRQAPSLPFGGDYVGPTGMDAFMEKLGEDFEIRPQLLDVFEINDSLVILHIDVTLTSRRTGATARMPALQMLRTLDGMVTELRPFYYDTHAIVDVATNE